MARRAPDAAALAHAARHQLRPALHWAHAARGEQHAAAVERCGAARKSRLLEIREVVREEAARANARRCRTLQRMKGEQLVTETAPYRIAHGLSRIEDSLPPELAREVVAIIRAADGDGLPSTSRRWCVRAAVWASIRDCSAAADVSR